MLEVPAPGEMQYFFDVSNVCRKWLIFLNFFKFCFKLYRILSIFVKIKTEKAILVPCLIKFFHIVGSMSGILIPPLP